MIKPACLLHKFGNLSVAYAVTDSIEIPNKWRKNTLTLAIIKGTTDIPDQAVEREIINLAVLRWQIETPLQIKMVKITDNPDIIISFLPSSQDPYFAEDSSILAWSGYPETSLQGQMHFNDDYRWSKDGLPISAHLADSIHYPDSKDPTTFRTYNLNQTFFHEFGHILGEVHIEDCPLCVMYPYYNDSLELQPIEITRIQNKYGTTSRTPNIYQRLKIWMHVRVRNE
jgi:hypothetical protein